MNHTQRLVTFVGTVVCALGLATGEGFAQADFFEGFNDVGSVPPGQQGPGGLIDNGGIFACVPMERQVADYPVQAMPHPLVPSIPGRR